MTEPMVTRPVRWLFGGSPGWSAEFATFLNWAKENWTEKRPLRVGFLIWDHASGYGVWEGSLYCPEAGVELVGREVTPMLGVIDTSVEWLRLVAKKPDWIYAYSAGATAVVYVKDAARLEIQKKGIKLAFAQALEESVVRIVGEDAEGWHVVRIFPTLAESELPGMKILLDVAKRHRGKGPDKLGGLYSIHWPEVLVLTEAMRRALEKVGLENLTSGAVRDALVTIKDFDTGILPPLTVLESPPVYNNWQRIYRIEKGKFIPLADWRQPPWLPPWAKE